ncbi:hypothetical protein N7452_005371 [Penicillium brevicompactum]|uniref:NACHT domain-containing protein n=1 Tax=Penicillium brevicompactum TaxID=5074 RepID=A0A9W9UF13_PENBR|nr:hypothetical protein N7452_005371 [Penicillium brevicompactum]
MTKSRFSFLRNLCCDKCLQEPTAEEGEYTPNIPKSSAGLPTSKSTRTEVSGEEVTSGFVAAEIFEVPCDSKSLWDEAYNNLKEEEAQLLDGYEKILSHRLRDESDEFFPASQENQINQKDSEIRRSQMRSAIEKGLKNTEKEAEFKQGATEVLQVALGLNDMITLAIKRVPEAALAWSVVSLSMQMFLNPLQQTEVNRVGIKYVMSKMDWYWELPAHLLQESEVKKDIYAKLRLELRQQIVDLYKSLLSYEIKSVCSYFRHRGLQFLRDFAQLEGWDGTLDQIQTAETALRQNSETYNVHQILDHHRQDTSILYDIGKCLEEQKCLQKCILEDEKNQECKKDLLLTNPAEDMARIESSKGFLLAGSCGWILTHPSFKEWEDSGTSQLLWIRGNPGKGKTMLLISVIKNMWQKPFDYRFLSFFFCQETDKDLNNATGVLRGLTHQLVVQHPTLITYLRKEYDNAGANMFNSNRAFYSLNKIFLNMLQDPRVDTIYLMLDALDECQTDQAGLLRLIRETMLIPSRKVKWLITSRHGVRIDQLHDVYAQSELNLDRNEEGQISNAVGMYINHKLNDLFKRYEKVYEKRDKDERETQGQAYDPSTLRLALEALNNVRAEVASVIREKANDTFLWVALVFQELAQTHDAHGILENVREMPSGLDKIYDRIMYKLLQEPQSHLQHCRQVLLVVLNAYRPLQLPELALLAGFPSDLLFNAGRVIESCSIVFLHRNNQTVHFVHQSAKDYLLEYMETDLPSKIFPDGRSFGHRQIVSRSLDGFSKVLKRDLYNLVQPGACLADLDESQIPRPDPLASMRYSCVYWIEHFCAILRYSDEGDSYKLQFSAFWKTNFLHWLEALSLIECVSDGVLAMAKLLEILDGISAMQSELLFVKDAHRFILAHRHIIETHPLQLYSAALIFSPVNSIVRKCYRDQEPAWLTLKPVVEHDWSPCFQTLEGHLNSVESIAWSHDGTRLASISCDSSVKIWDPAVGQCVLNFDISREFITFSGEYFSMAWSNDGGRLAAAIGAHVWIWDVITGQCVCDLQVCPNEMVHHTTWSHDASRLAIAFCDTLMIWDSVLNQCIRLSCPSFDRNFCSLIDCTSLACFQEGNEVAIVPGNADTETWTLIQCKLVPNRGPWLDVSRFVEEIHTSWSSGDSRVALSSENGVIIWDSDTGQCLTALEKGLGFERYGTGAWSHDGARLAIPRKSDWLQIWDSNTRKCVSMVGGHNGTIETIAWSPIPPWLASGSADGSIKVWDTEISQSVAAPRSIESVHSICWSPDKTKFAVSASVTGTGICDPSGRRLSTLENSTRGIMWRFAWSHDGTKLVCGRKGSVQVWDPVTGECTWTLERPGSDLDGKVHFGQSNSNHLQVDDETYDLRDETPRDISSLITREPLIPRQEALFGLAHDDSWLTKGGVNLLWLAPAYRPSIYAAFDSHGSNVLIGCNSGQVLILEFAEENSSLWDWFNRAIAISMFSSPC